MQNAASVASVGWTSRRAAQSDNGISRCEAPIGASQMFKISDTSCQGLEMLDCGLWDIIQERPSKDKP